MNRKAADYFHPVVMFAYSASLIIMAMLFFHPVFIVLGLLFAALQNLVLCKSKQFIKQLAWSLPFCLIVALFNPLTSHGGKTLLFYAFGSPITMESAIYGVCSGGMLLLVLLWFGVYNRIVSPDRFMYLFSRAVPSASMLLTMTQRMIPMFSRRLETIRTTQKILQPQLVESEQCGRIRRRVKPFLNEISILLSWSMEEGLDTADSMKARGYGSTRRTSVSVYRFAKRDILSLIFIAACDICCIWAYYSSVRIYFYPRISMSGSSIGLTLAAVSYVILACALPLAEAHWSVIWNLYNYNNTPKPFAAIGRKGE